MIPDALVEELKGFIKERYRFISLPGGFTPAREGFGGMGKGIMPGTELDQVSRLLSRFAREQRRPDFSHTLNALREERGLQAEELYKAAWVDKRLYSKIMTSGKYRPSKDTALQFAFALKLDEAGFAALLQSAGFALSDSSMRDLVFRFCVERGIFDLHDVNALLLAAEQKLLCKEPA
jgi:hypothetical protein